MAEIGFLLVAPGELRHIEIPVQRIAGTHPFNAPLPVPADNGEDDVFRVKPTFTDLLSENATAHAKAHGFKTWVDQVAGLMTLPSEDELPERVRYTKSEALYYDTGYLLASGGLTGASVSLPAVGGGLSVAPNVRRKALKRIKRGPRPISQLCGAGKTACISGYLEFYDLRKVPKRKREEYQLAIDGGLPFIPAYLRVARHSAHPDVALVLFRNVWAPSALDIWDRMSQPTRVFGDVVHGTPPRKAWSEFGCYMLARSAGVVV